MLPLVHPALVRDEGVDSATATSLCDPQRRPLSSHGNGAANHRFEVVISNRRAWRHLNRQLEGFRGTGCVRRPLLSKNCRTKRRMKDRERSYKPRNQNAQLEQAIADLQATVANLERSRCLMESAQLLRRTNRSAVAVDRVREYIRLFGRGYNREQAMVQDAFMDSVCEEDIFCREFKGIDNFVKQWESYTMYHGSITVQLCAVTLIDEDERYVSVRGAGKMRLVITQDTLKHLYPSFYEQAQRDPSIQALAYALEGQEYQLSFDLALHFNEQGRIFAHESKVHLASGLLQLLRDPHAAMRLLSASLMTDDGHWKFPHDHFHDSVYKLPKALL